MTYISKDPFNTTHLKTLVAFGARLMAHVHGALQVVEYRLVYYVRAHPLVPTT